MTTEPNSKLPLPVKVTAISFLLSDSAPSHAVLELRTGANPLRVFLTRTQLLDLAAKAQKAAGKIDSGYIP